MKKAILAKKIGMTRVFNEDGTVVPVTVLVAGPCTVVQKKSMERDGYEAIQLGFVATTEKHLTRAQRKHLEKNEAPLLRRIKEFRLEDCSAYQPGQPVLADVFAKGETVDVCGISKGKGFAGTIKRHNTARGRMSHGSHFHRAPGSMGGASSPSKVFKGKKLPGQMGHERITVQNLTVVDVDAEKNIILIKGGVPGPKGTVVSIVDAVKNV